ncbi:MAG: hypothetical protein KGL48_13630 [Sphingomonadales bacterium]|nr:hypothetical protein [Sphingomonadales bacterium]MDE2569311.1 hypothetical protein [Sphingomonadales bacterium]
MRRDFLEYHTSRAIAIYRLVLALLFGLLVWADSTRHAREPALPVTLYLGYLTVSLALLAVAWRSWWLEFRAGSIAALIDGAAFLLGVYYTALPTTNFFAPFLIFMVFMLIEASLRFGRAAAVLAAAGLCLAYLVVEARFVDVGETTTTVVFYQRFGYMVVLSMTFAWFGLRHAPPTVPRFSVDLPVTSLEPASQALAYAMRISGAGGGALAWAPEDEPLRKLQLAGSLESESPAPDIRPVDVRDVQSALAFDARKRRVLRAGPGNVLHAVPGAEPPRLATLLDVRDGLLVPIAGRLGKGVLLLTGIAMMSRDDIRLGQALADEIAMALDGEQMASTERNMAVARSRGSLARDLHDSVAQTLAGISFRLQALRQRMVAGSASPQEVETLIADLQAEQQQVRGIIDGLRNVPSLPESCELGEQLARLVDALGRQWSIAAVVDPPGRALSVPAPFAHEVQQLVREGVANAARHGHASRVRISLSDAGTGLSLVIADNGRGFAQDREEQRPRSLSERVAELHGSFAATSGSGGTTIEISLPRGVS